MRVDEARLMHLALVGLLAQHRSMGPVVMAYNFYARQISGESTAEAFEGIREENEIIPL
jgi:hypothetical protein